MTISLLFSFLFMCSLPVYLLAAQSELEMWKSKVAATPMEGEIIFSYEFSRPSSNSPSRNMDLPVVFWAKWRNADFIIKQLIEKDDINSPAMAPFSSMSLKVGSDYKNSFASTVQSYTKTNNSGDNIVVSSVEASGGIFYRALTFGLLPDKGEINWSGDFFEASTSKQSFKGKILAKSKSQSLPAEISFVDVNMSNLSGILRYVFEAQTNSFSPYTITSSLVQDGKEQLIARTHVLFMDTKPSEEDLAMLFSKNLDPKVREYLYKADGPYLKSGSKLLKVQPPGIKIPAKRANRLRFGLAILFTVPLIFIIAQLLRQRKKGSVK